MAPARAAPSARSVFIFQLPAMKGVRMGQKQVNSTKKAREPSGHGWYGSELTLSTGDRRRSQRSDSPAGTAKGEIGDDFAGVCYLDRLFTLPIAFMPGTEGVGAGRDAIDGELPGFIRHREEGVGKDADVRSHPRVDIASNLHR